MTSPLRVVGPALMLLAVLLAGAAGRAAEKEPVTATILPVAPGVFRVSVLFPGVPGEAGASAAMQTLVARSGWTPHAATWDTTPAEGKFPAQTGTSFLVNTLFPNGEFPVEAFAVAFRSFGEVNVMFAHGGTFQYKGQTRYENADAVLTATPGPTSLALHLVIKNPKLERFTLAPPLSEPAGQAPSRPARRVPPAAWALVAVLGGALAWVLVYAVFAKPRPR